MRKKKSRIWTVLVVLALVLVVAFLGMSFFIGKQIVDNTTQLATNETTKDAHASLQGQDGFDFNAFSKQYTVQSLSLTSTFGGHTIPVDWIYSGSEDKNVVILVHGLGGNRKTQYTLAAFFLENGYNMLTYDQRSSGDNTAQKTTFGVWEKHDLMDCIAHVKQHVPGRKIGVWGESFGGATAVHALAYKQVQQDVSFLILDCPASSMAWMVERELKKMNLNVPMPYMMWCGSLVNKLQLGFSYGEADAAALAKNIHVPTLVINSEKDAVTPVFMGKDIYDNLASAQKTLWTVTDSEHVGMWRDHNAEYRSRVLALMAGE